MFSSTFLDFSIQENNYNIKTINYNNKIYLNKSLKALLYSSIIPGSGQYLVNDDKTKGVIFLGLEIIALAGYNYYLNNADDYKIQYKNYGNEYWSFTNWCSNYYNWEDPNNDFFNIFSNSDGYLDIWEDSHHINFTYNDDGIIRFISSSSVAFQQLYTDELSTAESAQAFYDNNQVLINRDHNFYENIVKYNHFFAGWDDHEGIYTYDNNGYLVVTSNSKDNYRKIWDKSIKNYKIKNNFVSFIFVNHFVSMLDALIVSKISSNRTTMMINYNPRIDFYQAQLSIKLY